MARLALLPPLALLPCLLALLTGCPDTSLQCDPGFLERDGRCIRSDAGPDAATEDGGDADASACGACTAPTPLCRATDMTCVECLGPTDCASSMCNPDGRCVDCASSDDCTAPAAARCDDTMGSCVGCTADTDCTHLAGSGTPVCDEASATCVACTPDSEESTCPAPDMLACHPTDFTCTGARRGSLGSCQVCVSDSECLTSAAGTRRCVPLTVLGASASYCLIDRATATGMLCPSPYFDPREATSQAGVMATYCFPASTTCEAVLDFRTTCTTDDDCGATGVMDGLCRNDGAGLRCSYRCGGADECDGVLCSTDSPRYCCTSSGGPGCT